MPADSTQYYRVDPAELPAEAVIFGCTSAMHDIRKTIDRAICSDLPVLIQGESGTGKGVIARYLHIRSSRRNEPFVKLNCAAIPASLLESALFGYQKGSFNGAEEDRPGLIEFANGGTLFLDNIEELHSSLQVKLVHLLQNEMFTRVGGSKETIGRLRIICATSIDLETALRAGTFREDLFSCIDVVSLRLLPLCHRKADIPQLCKYFLQKLARQFGRNAPRLEPAVLDLLMRWDWPGNLRELENWIARAIILGDTKTLEAELKRQLGHRKDWDSRSTEKSTLKETSRRAIRSPSKIMIRKILHGKRCAKGKTAAHVNSGNRPLLFGLREVGLRRRRRRHRGTPPQGG
jgi:transcriptional regulator with PAS, ATPase and Fis domain